MSAVAATRNERLSLAALTVLHLAPPDMVTCAAAAGYGRVGLRLIPATPDEPAHPTFVGDSPLVREVEQRLRDTGVRVLDIEILRLRPDTDVRAYQPVLETGARLGAAHALVAGNDPERGRLIERFSALCVLAAPLGLTLALEPMPWTDVKAFADALSVVEASGQANAAVLVDAIHFDRAADSLAVLRGAPPERLRYLQLCDAPAERPHDMASVLQQARSARLMPGDGGLNLRGLLAAMPAQLPISLEVPMPELVRAIGPVAATTRLREKTEALLATLEARSRQETS
jgi:sugar phosphate isomerase/epimerase